MPARWWIQVNSRDSARYSTLDSPRSMSQTSPTRTSAFLPATNACACAANLSRASTNSLVSGSAAASFAIIRRAVNAAQRRRVEHGLGAGVGVLRDRLLARGRDPRVGDAVEVAARRRIREGERAEPLAIERALVGQDRRAEPGDEVGERGLARP